MATCRTVPSTLPNIIVHFILLGAANTALLTATAEAAPAIATATAIKTAAATAAAAAAAAVPDPVKHKQSLQQQRALGLHRKTAHWLQASAAHSTLASPQPQSAHKMPSAAMVASSATGSAWAAYHTGRPSSIRTSQPPYSGRSESSKQAPRPKHQNRHLLQYSYYSSTSSSSDDIATAISPPEPSATKFMVPGVIVAHYTDWQCIKRPGCKPSASNSAVVYGTGKFKALVPGGSGECEFVGGCAAVYAHGACGASWMWEVDVQIAAVIQWCGEQCICPGEIP